MQPDTHYATSGEVQIAYQVIGTGPLDLVLVPGYISNLDHAWEEPSLVHLISRLSSFSRLILFDKRGTGLSDRLGNLPTLEERMDTCAPLWTQSEVNGRRSSASLKAAR
jgi:pimeloyl-ACP methyl ester carboxylesterase